MFNFLDWGFLFKFPGILWKKKFQYEPLPVFERKCKVDPIQIPVTKFKVFDEQKEIDLQTVKYLISADCEWTTVLSHQMSDFCRRWV